MSRAGLWRLSARTTPAAAEAVGHFLAEVFGQDPVSYTDFEDGRTTVSLYLARKPDWGRSRLGELAAGLQRILGRRLRRSGRARSGLRDLPCQIALERLRRQDWAESWKRHFKPMEIGSALLIRPGWSQRRGRKGQATVVLDPGLSFGTGQHPTTAFCLEQLVVRRARGKSQSLLDLGAGSGILAIAGAKLGYAPVQAIDWEAEAVGIAAVNARRNRVSHKVRFRQADVAELPQEPARKYGVVCANLEAPILLAERRRIVAQLDKNGVLVVAGILRTEFRQLQKAYEAEGLRLIASRSGKEWRSGAFAWKRDTGGTH